MTRFFLIASVSALVLAACATPTAQPAKTDTVSVAASTSIEIAEPIDTETPAVLISSPLDFKFAGIDSLISAGNTQAGIDGLSQLLIDEDLTVEETNIVLARRGDLRASKAGYDLMGGIADYGTVLESAPAGDMALEVQAKLDIAKAEAASLNAALERPETPRSQIFESRFRLGQHDEALDLMFSSGLEPDNDSLIAMYQIGYLCTGETQTGPAYNGVEPDGTPRELRFCDFGK